MHLCSLAAEEKDPVRLTKLVHEICELLDAKQRRLEMKPPSHPKKERSESRAQSGVQKRPLV